MRSRSGMASSGHAKPSRDFRVAVTRCADRGAEIGEYRYSFNLLSRDWDWAQEVTEGLDFRFLTFDSHSYGRSFLWQTSPEPRATDSAAHIEVQHRQHSQSLWMPLAPGLHHALLGVLSDRAPSPLQLRNSWLPGCILDGDQTWYSGKMMPVCHSTGISSEFQIRLNRSLSSDEMAALQPWSPAEGCCICWRPTHSSASQQPLLSPSIWWVS